MGISRLAAFFFILQVSTGLVNAMNVFPTYNVTQSVGFDAPVQVYNSTNMSYITAGVNVASATTYGFGDYLWSVIHFASLIFGFVVGIYGLLVMLGFDPVVASAVQLIAFFSYAEAVIGIIRGQSLAGY